MSYDLSFEAENDVIEAYVYGFENFGEAQAETYGQGLKECFELIAAHPRLGREHTEFTPPVRIHHHASHYIVYDIRGDDVFIIRVLPDRADLTRHLRP